MDKIFNILCIIALLLSASPDIVSNDTFSREKINKEEKSSEKKEIKTKIKSIETGSKAYLWVCAPSPQPASAIVKTMIYWDSRYEFDVDKIQICDILGSKLDVTGKITLNRVSDWSGDLIWECANTPGGVYFILVRHGNNAKTIKVILGK